MKETLCQSLRCSGASELFYKTLKKFLLLVQYICFVAYHVQFAHLTK